MCVVIYIVLMSHGIGARMPHDFGVRMPHGIGV